MDRGLALMARVAPKAKKATPDASTPDKKVLAAHEIVMSPLVQNAVGIHAWSKFAGDADLSELVKDLDKRIEKVQAGDMRSVEAMLYGQAMTLQTIFTSLARKATSQEYLKQFQAYLGMALKAQAQCRATLEALAEIKNPRPVAFLKQANISGGHQQVNNGLRQPVQQTGSAHGGEEIKSLPAPGLETKLETADEVGSAAR
ncbi:hypothetical protein ACFPOE_18955 [Caenimonas terrae]|uniref:Phasin family protein n=1 Tax=Caenimonas terrae TaxID=696074 RepID=A0ABW0NHV1_9BURK